MAASGSAAAAATPVTRRWTEEKWALDQVIQANGMDWDQGRSRGLAATCGPEAEGDVAALRARIKKFADFAHAYEAAARRREAEAREHEASGEMVSARDNYFFAAQFWMGAQWPIYEKNDQNMMYNARKRECYEKYAQLSDHHVEAVSIPLGNNVIPAYFHLPPSYKGGKIPAIVSIPGMDGAKEGRVALYGDRWLERGFAVLAVDGPGEYESPLLGSYVRRDAWLASGPALANWLSARSEVDAQKLGIIGTSFGSLFGTWASSAEPRFRAVAVQSTCLEPGCHTIFEQASPTFKMRFMFMSGYTDEGEFNKFAKTLTWEGYAEKIRVPYLCVAGEADELCPIENTERMFKVMQAPRNLLVYQDSRHSIAGVPSAANGPSYAPLMANWMTARLNGKPMASERWYVEASGRVNKTAYA
ncbi:MAG TPA: prolyl oligopeptidase family serine peptidase [Candidatus Binatia bacterium]|nr:prolyl oligopeptidase family serine peptidase [Candidatus Binatia bacterium]